MRPTRSVPTVLLVVSLLWPSTAASGGGWWSSPHLESKYAAIGRKFSAQTEFAFASLEESRRIRAEGAYVYLLSEWDRRALDKAMGEPFGRDWWDPSDARTVRVGEVEIHPKGGLWRARTEFEVPEIAPGGYWLMFCDAGCRHSFGDLIPVRIRVVSDPAIARLDRVANNLREQALLQRSRLWQAQRKAEEARDDVRDLSAQLALLRMQPAPEVDNGMPWWSFAGWLVAGVGLTLLAGTARSRRRRWDDFRFADLPPPPEQPERERIGTGA